MATGLEGMRVIEVAAGLAASYAGKLVTDLGAEVVKLEPPGGDPVRGQGPPPGDGTPAPHPGGLFHALNAGKRSRTADLTAPEGRSDLEALAGQAHLLVHDHAPAAMGARGLDYARLSAANPALVMVSITPFGLSGPHRDWDGCELTAVHGGGWGWLAPTASREADKPPLKPFGQQAAVMAGAHGAMAGLGACYGALVHGRGEHVDLSAQSVVAGMLEMNFVRYTYAGQVASRLGVPALGPWGFYPCADGRIFLVCIEEDQWRRLVKLMGEPEWASLEVLADPYLRAENRDFMDPLIGEWTSRWTVDDLFHACQAERICAAPVFGYAGLPQQEHLRQRNFLVDLEGPGGRMMTLPGAPYRLRDNWWALRGRAPAAGEADGEPPAFRTPRAEPPAPAAERPGLPLAGVRVLDLTWVWAGPYATMFLGFLGAEVIKVESALRPDITRRFRTFPPDMEPGLNRSGYFNQWSQGKRSVTINLAEPRGVELVRELARHSDVVAENFATGVMERLGLGPDVLHDLNPELIQVSMSGYGHTGPLKDYMGYGPAIVPLGGLSSLTGYGDGEPREVGMSYGDPCGGVHAAFAVIASLLARRRHGGGQVIDVSLWETMCCAGIEGWVGHQVGAGFRPDGNRDWRWAPHNVYRCAGDDAWVALAATDEAQWRALCDAMGRPGLAEDPRFAGVAARKAHEDELDAIIGEWTAARERWAAAEALQAAGVPAYPSLSSEDLVGNPQLEARGYFERLAHPEVGVRTHTGIPWRTHHAPNGVRAPAPLLGQDTDAVLSGILGLSAAEIAELREKNVLV